MDGSSNGSDPEGMDEVIGEFLVESYENLDQLDRDFLVLAEQPSDRAVLSRVFRTIHTIKGTCGFLGYRRLEAVTHVAEHLLSRLRDGAVAMNDEIASVLLDTVDVVRSMLQFIELDGTDGPHDHAELIDRLAELHHRVGLGAGGGAGVGGGSIGDGTVVARAAAPAPDAAAGPAFPPPAGPPLVAPVDPPSAATSLAATPISEVPLQPLGELLVDMGAAERDQVSLALSMQGLGDARRLGEILVESGAIAPESLEEALYQQAGRGEPTARLRMAESTVRVDVEVLDRLMNLVGELVLARNQIAQHLGARIDPGLVTASQRLDQVTSSLQNSVMKARMQPIRHVWAKFPRVVRDLAVGCGKQVRVEIHGDDTELDRTVIEAIKDPLTHIVRNAIDHGIESPDDRVHAGKPATGTLRMHAHHEGDQVVIEVRDDGGGIDVQHVKAKAITLGLVGLERASTMSDVEAQQLVFVPGFSTSDVVTNVSGRGVGMDVVKTNIEAINGQVELTSERGVGTAVRIKIPVTLAIVPALIVESAEQRFAVPQPDVIELVQLGGEGRRAVELLHDLPVFRLRGNVVPLLWLDHRLGLAEHLPQPGPDDLLNVVVVGVGGQTFGLVVDAVITAQEIVVKPLSTLLQSVEVFSGATIMGDGSLALIVDSSALAARAGLGRPNAAVAVGVPVRAAARDEATTAVLVATSLDGTRRMVLPLDDVLRLEDVEVSALQQVAAGTVARLRDDIVTLVDVVDGGRVTVSDGTQRLTAVVHRAYGPTVALVVGSTLDIVEGVALRGMGADDAGTVLVGDRVAEWFDPARCAPSLLSIGTIDLGAVLDVGLGVAR